MPILRWRFGHHLDGPLVRLRVSQLFGRGGRLCVVLLPFVTRAGSSCGDLLIQYDQLTFTGVSANHP